MLESSAGLSSPASRMTIAGGEEKCDASAVHAYRGPLVAAPASPASSSPSSYVANDAMLWAASTLPTPPLESPVLERLHPSKTAFIASSSSSSSNRRTDDAKMGSLLLDILATPPIATALVTYISRTDLPNLRLVCKHAYQTLTYSDQYYLDLLDSAIQCEVATDPCRSAEAGDHGRCLRCDKTVCRYCIPGLAQLTTFSSRSRSVCAVCRPTLIRGRCECAVSQRWICRDCHTLEILRDRNDLQMRYGKHKPCYVCMRPIADRSPPVRLLFCSFFWFYLSVLYYRIAEYGVIADMLFLETCILFERAFPTRPRPLQLVQ
ncbi:hypothetical protein BZA70DRAFT_279718 [Myxozyma melibiosi]|uniref:F-box domain-containing protein n=1 Tax=Myxozyma melibiosi TaxID=54550 RepID=A0ABR1F497_9ASCO